MPFVLLQWAMRLFDFLEEQNCLWVIPVFFVIIIFAALIWIG